MGLTGGGVPYKMTRTVIEPSTVVRFLPPGKWDTAAFCVVAVGNSCVPLTFERIFRDPSGFALLSHLPLQGRQEVCLLIVSKIGRPWLSLWESCHGVTERGKDSCHEVTAAVGNAALCVPQNNVIKFQWNAGGGVPYKMTRTVIEPSTVVRFFILPQM